MSVPIVVVDDSEVDRYLLSRVIKSLGLDVKFVQYEDGEDFVNVIRDHKRMSAEISETPPRILVFLDVNMPRMNGFEVLDAIEQELNTQTPFVFVTMYSSSNHARDKEDAMNYSFVKDFIVKPVTEDKLRHLIMQLYPDLPL